MTEQLQQTLKEEFNLFRLIDNNLTFNKCQLIFDIKFNSNSTKIARENSFKSIHIWIKNVINNSLAYNVFNSNNIDISELKNPLIFCPAEPHDYLMLYLIHSKINAIGQGNVIITRTSFCADDMLSFSYSGNAANELPDISTWMGAYTYFDNPWWTRSDGSTIDMPADEYDDLNNKPDILIELCHTSTAEIIKPNFRVVE